MQSIETELKFNSRVIQTNLHGHIKRNQILSVIREWTYLNSAFQGIKLAVFDFTGAVSSNLCKDDMIDIAIRTKQLTDSNKDIRILVIVKSEREERLANLWQSYALNLLSTSYGQAEIFRCSQQALDRIKRVVEPLDGDLNELALVC